MSLFFFIVAGLVLGLSQPLKAQVLYGSVVGTVTDQTGAVVPKAAVTINNKGTGQSKETATDESGRYLFNNVLAGTYDLKVTASGFKPYSQTHIEVTINTVTRVDLRLEVGAVAETITVEASATRLQSDKADVHVELNVAAMKNLTLPNYRNYQSLINLVPGATPAGLQNAVTDTPARALTNNINGANRNNNNTKLDGSTNVYIWLPHHTVYVAPIETIETVNIATNNFDAEQGMAGGAAITVTTKSGTNEFHGTAFAFHDNQVVRARNFFLRTPQKPKSITNIDGGTFGGPIVKNKLFFFGGWEGYRERLNRNRQLTVATAEQRTGNFTSFGTPIYDPLTGNALGQRRMRFPNDTIPVARQSAISRRMQELVPLPNQPGVTANFFANGTQAMNRDNYDVKINWNRTERHSVLGKYSVMDAQVTGAFALGAAGGECVCDGGLGGVGDTFVQVAAVGHTWTLGPRFLIDGTLGWTRMGQVVKGPDFGKNFGLEVLGIPGTNGPDVRQSGMPSIDISGYSTLGNPAGWSPIFRNDQSFTLTQNASWTRGAHDIRFGFEGIHHHLNHWQPEIGGGPRGRFNFTGGVTALAAGPLPEDRAGPAPNQYNGYAAFLLGLPFQMGKSIQFIKMTGLEWQFGWYLRDRWRVTRKLTLNLGLRYELYPLMTRANGGIERYDQVTNQLFLGGYGNQPKNVGVTTSRKMFAPRFGIAYQLTPSMVIRGGYGITYNPMPLGRPLRGFFPLTIASDFNADNAFQAFRPWEQGIPEFCCPDLGSGVLQLDRVVEQRTPFLGQLKRGYIQSWNLVVERKLPADFVVSVGYVGTQTIHSFADLNINAGQVVGAGNAGRPAFAQFGRIANTLLWQGWLNANYHSLQTTINRHFTRGLMVKGAYTYSKAINRTDDDGWAGVGWNMTSQLPRNRAQAGYNIPHIFHVGYVYELPFGKGKKWTSSGGVTQAVLGDWQINGIFSFYQGRPFTVGSSGASLNAPGNLQTADQVKSDVRKLGGIGAENRFYDTTAYRAIIDGRFGTTGRNTLRGPGVVNVGLSLFRTFKLTERFDLQFKAESFNLSNTPHFSNPRADVSNPPAFMTIVSAAGDERQFRFGLRLSF